MNIIHTEDIARLIAELVNPALAIVLLAAPWVPRRPEESPWQFWATCLIALLIAWSIADNGKAHEVWSGHPTFPSGHESFAAAASTCLARYDRDWIWLMAPILAVFGWALVTAGYHDPEDIYGGLVVGPVSAFLAAFAVAMLKNKLRLKPSRT